MNNLYNSAISALQQWRGHWVPSTNLATALQQSQKRMSTVLSQAAKRERHVHRRQHGSSNVKEYTYDESRVNPEAGKTRLSTRATAKARTGPAQAAPVQDRELPLAPVLEGWQGSSTPSANAWQTRWLPALARMLGGLIGEPGKYSDPYVRCFGASKVVLRTLRQTADHPAPYVSVRYVGRAEEFSGLVNGAAPDAYWLQVFVNDAGDYPIDYVLMKRGPFGAFLRGAPKWWLDHRVEYNAQDNGATQYIKILYSELPEGVVVRCAASHPVWAKADPKEQL